MISVRLTIPFNSDENEVKVC